MRASTDPFDRQVRHHRRPTWRTWSDNSLEPFFFLKIVQRATKNTTKTKQKASRWKRRWRTWPRHEEGKKKIKEGTTTTTKKKGNVEVVRTAHKWRLDVSRPPIFHLRSPWVTAPNLPLSLSLSHSLSHSLCLRSRPLPSLSPAGAQLSKNDKFDCLFLSWPRELLRRRRRRRRRRRPNAETKNDNLFHQLP